VSKIQQIRAECHLHKPNSQSEAGKFCTQLFRGLSFSEPSRDIQKRRKSKSSTVDIEIKRTRVSLIYGYPTQEFPDEPK